MFTVQVDSEGRITLPREVLEALGVQAYGMLKLDLYPTEDGMEASLIKSPVTIHGK